MDESECLSLLRDNLLLFFFCLAVIIVSIFFTSFQSYCTVLQTQTLFPLYSLALCENDLSFHFFKLTIPVVCFNFLLNRDLCVIFRLKRRRSKKIRKTIFRFLSYTIFFLLTEFFQTRTVPFQSVVQTICRRRIS